jgi:pimeloyl-ACP methyl ester carboxylesterase
VSRLTPGHEFLWYFDSMDDSTDRDKSWVCHQSVSRTTLKRIRMRTILIIAAVAAFLYVGLCLVLFLAQRSFIYYPQPKSAADHNPSLTLDVNGARVVIATRPTGPDAVIYFGGNAESVSMSLPTLAEAYPGRSLFAMNYRGYGGSTGTPSEAALIADALVLFDHVHSDHAHIIVIGRSLGSGVAVHIASLRRPVERLVLVTPYDSLAEIAASQFRIFPVRWLLIDKFESWRYAPKVTAPTQLLAAQYDDIIPYASTRSLYQHFPEGLATLTVIPMVGHNSISESPDYIPLLRGAQ